MKAFPSGYIQAEEYRGMDLRDYFAAKAMQALITNFEFKGTQIIDITPINAYQIADAMMKAREVNNG
jgi:hypothetical protein